jgi:hypothetical protein
MAQFIQQDCMMMTFVIVGNLVPLATFYAWNVGHN